MKNLLMEGYVTDMKQNRHTKELLLQAAKKEFLEKGYMKASLRSICKKADVTTGALYFFFQGKEDLFGSLVETPLQEIYQIMKHHYDAELSVLTTSGNRDASHAPDMLRATHSSSDTAAVFQSLEYMYRYREEFLLLITKAQGSEYENCIDRFVELSEQHYRRMADLMAPAAEEKTIDENTIHCIVHLQMETFIYPITHNLTLEEAKKQMSSMTKFLTGGWYNLWQTDTAAR